MSGSFQKFLDKLVLKKAAENSPDNTAALDAFTQKIQYCFENLIFADVDWKLVREYVAPDFVQHMFFESCNDRTAVKNDTGEVIFLFYSIHETDEYACYMPSVINDGEVNVRHNPEKSLPEGFTLGRKRFKHKKTAQIVQCPVCSVSGKGGNMKRYHFDNCKAKHEKSK